jgi:hypothetical protein
VRKFHAEIARSGGGLISKSAGILPIFRAFAIEEWRQCDTKSDVKNRGLGVRGITLLTGQQPAC